jgi:pyruvate carboxylase
LKPINGRPGVELKPIDFSKVKVDLREKYGELSKDGFELHEATDALSAVLYPQVFKEYAEFCREYGDISNIPTEVFLTPMVPGQMTTIDIEPGKSLFVKYLSSSAELDEQGRRTVVFELNGVAREVRVVDKVATSAPGASKVIRTVRADKSNPGHQGAPMPGTIISLHYKVGDKVKKGAKIAVLSAMKMETVVSASKDGVVKEVIPLQGDLLSAGDLIMNIE